MSAFDPLKNATITVARSSSTNNDGDPTYGSQTTVSVRQTSGVVRRAGPQGLVSDNVTRLATDEWEFQKTDGLWIDGADTSDDGAAINPASVGKATTAGVSLYTAEL